jgi:radical SAM superfamily enzyme YgiQ (UPF0313 family)
MHVIFLNSIYSYIPQRALGPYLLKHQLKKRGYTSQVIDYCQELSPEQILELFKKFATTNTVCLALSSTFWFDETQYYYTFDNGIPPNIYQAIKLIKLEYPKVRIVLGGAHSSYMRTRLEDVDCVFIGESEDTFVEVLDHWTTGAAEPWTEINPTTKKLTYRNPITKNYQIQSCDFMWQDEDCIQPGEALPMETARGCIFKCSFCAYPHLGKKKFDYLKSNDTIRNYLVNNYNKWQTTSYIMLDDTFNDSEFKIDGFLELTRSLPFKIEYAAYIRADLVHRFEGMADKLAETGLRGAFFGLESLHPTASRIVGKGWSGKSAREFVPELVHNIWKNKITAHCGLIVGLPGENEDDLQNTVTWVNDNMINVVFFGLQVTNNLHERSYISEFERNAEKYGFKFDSKGKWYNDIWSRDSVLAFAAKLNPKRKRLNFAGFNHIALHSLGYANEEIISQHQDTIKDSNEFKLRKNQFIQNYFNALRTL